MMGSPKIVATACGSTLSSIETKINELNIYPNPTSRKFKINSPTEFKLVTLYNVNGQEVYHTRIVDNIVNRLEALLSGMYLAYFEDLNGTLYHSKISISQ